MPGSVFFPQKDLAEDLDPSQRYDTDHCFVCRQAPVALHNHWSAILCTRALIDGRMLLITMTKDQGLFLPWPPFKGESHGLEWHVHQKDSEIYDRRLLRPPIFGVGFVWV